MKQKRSLILVILALVALLAAIGSSVLLESPKPQTLDQHVHSVAAQLKCPVCQSESVADSNSTIAQQMRESIRQQLQAGKSDQQVQQFFVDRYGPSIVWSPPWQGFSLLAWLVPIVLVLGGAVLLFFVLRAWQTSVSQTSEKVLMPEDDEPVATDLEPYRAQLERELFADDPLFSPYRTEVR